MQVKIDEEKCIGCGNCANMCPMIFEMDGDKAKVAKPEGNEECDLEEVKNLCPSVAISLE